MMKCECGEAMKLIAETFEKGCLFKEYECPKCGETEMVIIGTKEEE